MTPQELTRRLPDGLANVRATGKVLRLIEEAAAAARRSERKN